MQKSTFSPHYDIFKTKLVTMRKAAGLTQRQLARRLKREHSFVSRIELGERRLDILYSSCQEKNEELINVVNSIS